MRFLVHWMAPLFVGLAATALSAEWATVPSESTIGFTAFSRMHDVDGRFGSWAFSGKISDDWKGTGRLVLRADSVDSGSAKRDAHLKNGDFFDAARYPELVYEIDSARSTGDRLLLSGKLTIRGISRPLNLDLARSVQGSRAELTGETVINRKDFGISYSSMMNPIKDDVKLKFRVVLAHK